MTSNNKEKNLKAKCKYSDANSSFIRKKTEPSPISTYSPTNNYYKRKSFVQY
jgi:hypothetical protein